MSESVTDRLRSASGAKDLERAVRVPGEVVEDVTIPARGFLRARRLTAGDTVRFIDVEGQQVPDVILYDASNLKNVSSMTNTVLIAQSWKITAGHSLYAKFGQKMATITEDTVGVNVSMGGFCNNDLNRVRYGVDGTHSCRSNFASSMAEYGFSLEDIQEGCFVPFMNVPYEPDGTCVIRPPVSKPGDYLDLRADMELLLSVSNCPQELNDCNVGEPTPLRLVIFRSGDSGSIQASGRM